MRLTVVIVTYNSARCIAECVRALVRVLPDCEVIIVDNMSVDATLAIATATDTPITVVQMGYNAGFGRACNEGVRRAAHDHVLLMNPDVVVLRAARDELEVACAKVSLGLVAPELGGAHPGGHAQAQLFACRSWLRELIHMAFDPFEPRELSRRPRIARAGAPAWACGALLLVRRSEFLALGGFDERFFLFYEDQELAARYRAASMPIRGTTAIRARHRWGGSSGAARVDLVDRMAWCLLGWLEFVAMDKSPARARTSWLIVRRAHRAGRTLAAVLARAQTGRMGRKAEQMASLEDAIRHIANSTQHTTHPFCPSACKVVAGVS